MLYYSIPRLQNTWVDRTGPQNPTQTNKPQQVFGTLGPPKPWKVNVLVISPKNEGKVGSHGIGRVYEKFPPNSFFTSSHTKDWTKTDAEAREISPLYENLSLVHEGQGGCLGCLVGWCWEEIMFWMGPAIRSNRETPFLKQSRISCGKEGSRRSPVCLVAWLGFVVFFVLFRPEVVLGRWRCWTQKLYG